MDLIGINFVGEKMSRLGDQGKVILKITQFCKQSIANGYKIVLIPFCLADFDAMVEMSKEFDDNMTILNFWDDNIQCDLSKFFMELKKCSFFVTERLHASIYSAFLGVPFFSLAYKSKCFDFVDSLSLDKQIIFNQNNIDLVNEFNKLKNDIALYDEISLKVEDFRKKLRRAADEIISISS